MPWSPDPARYEAGMPMRRCGRSGVLLPAVSLGLWQNFGGADVFEVGRAVIRRAFDLGVTHFDLANNYGPPPGSAEEAFGRILKADFAGHREELLISSKAGFRMQPGPYGEGGSRKYLVESCDASLRRMGLDHVDIFYHHCHDPRTPLEETMGALDHIVRSGRALYAGISNYGAEHAAEACAILRRLGTPCLIHQPIYNMLERWVEDGLLEVLDREGAGLIAYCPLAQGLLTDKYLGGGVPEGSRAAKPNASIRAEMLSDRNIARLRALDAIAQRRGQALAAMAIEWLLRQPGLTSVLVGARSVAQLEQNIAAARGAKGFSDEELAEIDRALAG